METKVTTDEHRLQVVDTASLVVCMTDMPLIGEIPSEVAMFLRLSKDNMRTMAMLVLRLNAKLNRCGPGSKEIADGVGRLLLDLPLWAEFDDTNNEGIERGRD